MRDEKSGLMRLLGQRVRGKWEVENGHPMDPEAAVIDARIPGHFHGHARGMELPVRLGQLAGGDGSVVHDVTPRPTLFHQFSAESKGVIRDELDVAPARLPPCRAHNVVEAAKFSLDVVLAPCRLDVLIIGATFEDHVPFRGGRPALGIERHFVRGKNPRPVEDFGAPVQLVDRAVFFLLLRANRRFLLRRRCRTGGK